jgi:predicted Zn-dependent peptidase
VKILKRFFCILIAAALVLPLVAQKDPKTLKYPDLEFKPLKPDHISLGKNFEFYFKEDHEAPTITLAIIIRSGSLLDPKDEPGLSQLTYQLLATGGSKTLTPEQVEEQLDFLGSSIYAYSGTEYGQIQVSSLAKNFDKTWEILMGLLFEPRFAPERLDLEKKKEMESILRRWDQPMMVGFTLFQDLVYGKDYPEVQRTTRKGLEAIGDKDIHQFYNDHLRNRAIIIAATGDFSGAKLADKIKTSLSGWKAQAPEKLEIPKAKLAAKPGIYLIDKPDMNQAVIMMGHLGINRLDADIAESNVFNAIYGSGAFNSRLWREVRSIRGLAYSASGLVSSGRDLGLFYTFSMTKNQSAGEAISVIRDVIKDMAQNPVKPEELETAKKSEINSFVFRFENPQSLLLRTILQRMYGMPLDYNETYLAKIRKVDAAKVLEMGKRFFHPDQLVILVVGKKADLLEQLKKLGDVIVLPLPEE